MSKKPVIELSRYQIIDRDDHKVAMGFITPGSHPKFGPYGGRVTTSRIIDQRTLKSGERRITTRNSIYKLVP